MVLGFICICALASATGLTLLTGGFGGYWWLLWMPLGFLGGFILSAALAFGVFVLICKFIDPEKPREEDCPWFRWLVLSYVHAVLTILPIRIETRGLENIPKDGRFLLVSNHLHNIDPAFLLNGFRKTTLSFVAKREAKQMFLVCKVLPKLMCSFINRENDREALKTILRCIKILKEDKASVAIFPEGRINKYRKLAHFRPGVFKIAQKANVPVVVCTLQNTQDVLPRLFKLKTTVVKVHLLEVIPAEELQGVTTVDIAERVYQLMAADVGPENVLTPEEEENA